MLIDDSPKDERELALDRMPVEVVASEDGVSPLSLVLPPYEVLAEIEAVRDGHFSVRDISHATQSAALASVALDRSRLQDRYEQFRDSPTYLARLAYLNRLAGDVREEERILREGRLLHEDAYFQNRLAESVLSQHRVAEAAQLFLGADLSTNLYANLRLASLYAQDQRIEEAEGRVSAALAIDALDFGARMFDGALKIWRGDYRAAILSFKVASESRPTSAALHSNMAVAYVRLGRQDKALIELKKAVAIDPLSSNAVTLLADVSHSLQRHEDAVPSLRFFLRFEQKSAAVWGRLARSLIGLRQASEAHAALVRQASLEETSSVWNNIGVTYHEQRNIPRALESYKRAMQLAEGKATFDYCVAARNAATLFGELSDPKAVLDFLREAIEPANLAIYAEDSRLSTVFITKLHALSRLGKWTDAARFGEEVLAWHDKSEDLEFRTATGLLSLYSLNPGGFDRAVELANHFYGRVVSTKTRPGEVRNRLLNNLAFVFIEQGKLEVAAHLLEMISSEIHRKPYPTATLGLFHLRKGHRERADLLYSQALTLCHSSSDKARIRQKWNLELGKLLMSSNSKRAARYLLKAKEASDAESGLARVANELLRQLPQS